MRKMAIVYVLLFGACLLFPIDVHGQSIPPSPRIVYSAGGPPDGETTININGYNMDSTTGALTSILSFPAGSGYSAFVMLAADPSGKFIYMANQFSGNVSGFAIDPNSGALTPVPGSPFATGGLPSSVLVDPTGRFVYVGDYWGSAILEYVLDPTTGALTPAGSPVYVASLVSALAVEPTGKFLYVSGNFINAYSIDPMTGALSLVAGSPFSSATYGEALTVDRAGRALYEAGTGISAFRIDPTSGTLTVIAGSPFETGSNFPAVAVDPSGTFVYVSKFTGDASYIYEYIIDSSTGALRAVPGSPYSGPGDFNYGISVDPSGKFVFVADANFGVVAYDLNLTTGALTLIPGTSPFPPGATAIISVASRFIDFSPPVITCGSSDGQWHAHNVSIPCTASDSQSGLENSADASFNLNTSIPLGVEDANASTTSRNVCDRAGNCASAGPISGNKVDRKGPKISITSPRGTYLLNASALTSYACTDGGSGLASCSGPVASGAQFDASPVGANAFVVYAVDNVGNSASGMANYIIQYSPAGTLCFGDLGHQVLQPINADGTSVFKQGRTIPAKFRVCNAKGVSIGTPGVVSDFYLAGAVSSTATKSADELAASGDPVSGFRWDSVAQQWIFNISTQTLAANAPYVCTISLNDGTGIVFRFRLK